MILFFFFFKRRRRHTILQGNGSSAVASSNPLPQARAGRCLPRAGGPQAQGTAGPPLRAPAKLRPLRRHQGRQPLKACATLWHTERLPLGAVCFLRQDRKSTRLNSSHLVISYAVFCLKKKNRYTNYSFMNYRCNLLFHISPSIYRAKRLVGASSVPTYNSSSFRRLRSEKSTTDSHYIP